MQPAGKERVNQTPENPAPMAEDCSHHISKGRRPTLILRTQLTVRVHAILEKLYNSNGPELRRSLFSLKQLFQEDKDLVPEFVNSEGLTCLIKVGAEADQNYQNYILRIMLFVDGMNGVINHNETVQWLYTLCGSPVSPSLSAVPARPAPPYFTHNRLVVKTALKLLIVFVEYTESNAPLLIKAVNTVDHNRGTNPWSNLIDILEEKNGADSELLVFAMTLINKEVPEVDVGALPDQDSFYDVTDCLEQLGMERLIQRHMNHKGTDPDLKQRLALYESALRLEDGDNEESSGVPRKDRRKNSLGVEEGRRSRRSLGNSAEVWAKINNTTPVAPPIENSSNLRNAAKLCTAQKPAVCIVSPPEKMPPPSPPSCEVEQNVEPPSPDVTPSSEQNRFLENLAATELEKMSALSKGRQEVLAEAVRNGGDSDDETSPAQNTDSSGVDDFGSGEEISPGVSPPPTMDRSSSKKFMLDMLYTKKQSETETEILNAKNAASSDPGKPPRDNRPPTVRTEIFEPETSPTKVPVENGSDSRKGVRAQYSIDAETNAKNLEKTLMTPFKKPAETLWEQTPHPPTDRPED
ncbi:unnamed protein product [Ranitomeya imitator]|uniref:GBD/FH3 domain-containing protein n=1 Tax=Ranitomeya imitator TaxID=111125 RepID=A0ABN9L676_9NEOB|nr:unnamed protein product [Ranitomeya imitator]